MAKTKKRNKKYSKHKAINASAKVLTRDRCILYCAGEPYQQVNMNTFTLEGSSQTERDCYSKVRYKWSVLAAALCVDDFGKPYIRSEQLDFKELYLHEEIQELCANELIRIVNSCNQNHFKTLGFLLSPSPRDFDPEVALMLFEKAKCFDHTVQVAA